SMDGAVRGSERDGGARTRDSGTKGAIDASVRDSSHAIDGSSPASGGGDAAHDSGGSDKRGDAGRGDRDAGGARPAFEPCAELGLAQIRTASHLPDGSGVIVGLAGAVAKLIDPNDGHELRSFVGHAGAINASAVSGNGE